MKPSPKTITLCFIFLTCFSTKTGNFFGIRGLTPFEKIAKQARHFPHPRRCDFEQSLTTIHENKTYKDENAFAQDADEDAIAKPLTTQDANYALCGIYL